MLFKAVPVTILKAQQVINLESYFNVLVMVVFDKQTNKQTKRRNIQFMVPMNSGVRKKKKEKKEGTYTFQVSSIMIG